MVSSLQPARARLPTWASRTSSSGVTSFSCGLGMDEIALGVLGPGNEDIGTYNRCNMGYIYIYTYILCILEYNGIIYDNME